MIGQHSILVHSFVYAPCDANQTDQTHAREKGRVYVGRWHSRGRGWREHSPTVLRVGVTLRVFPVREVQAASNPPPPPQDPKRNINALKNVAEMRKLP